MTLMSADQTQVSFSSSCYSSRRNPSSGSLSRSSSSGCSSCIKLGLFLNTSLAAREISAEYCKIKASLWSWRQVRENGFGCLFWLAHNEPDFRPITELCDEKCKSRRQPFETALIQQIEFRTQLSVNKQIYWFHPIFEGLCRVTLQGNSRWLIFVINIS